MIGDDLYNDIYGAQRLKIEGILMSMYDVRLRLSNQVVESILN